MNLRSQLVQIQIEEKGKTATYYTYDGYYAKEDRLKIRQHRKRIQRKVTASAFLTSLLAYYASRKSTMADINYRSYRVPTRGLLSGVISFVGSLLVFDYIGTQQLAEFENNVAKNSNKRAAVNPDRAYFELVDSLQNQPSIFHSGLTPESAAELIPDLIIGRVPPKPHLDDHKH